MLAVGLFAEKDHLEGFSAYAGLFHGGGFYLLGVQILACVSCILWSACITFLLIKVTLATLSATMVVFSNDRRGISRSSWCHSLIT